MRPHHDSDASEAVSAAASSASSDAGEDISVHIINIFQEGEDLKKAYLLVLPYRTHC